MGIAYPVEVLQWYKSLLLKLTPNWSLFEAEKHRENNWRQKAEYRGMEMLVVQTIESPSDPEPLELGRKPAVRQQSWCHRVIVFLCQPPS